MLESLDQARPGDFRVPASDCEEAARRD